MRHGRDPIAVRHLAQALRTVEDLGDQSERVRDRLDVIEWDDRGKVQAALDRAARELRDAETLLRHGVSDKTHYVLTA